MKTFIEFILEQNKDLQEKDMSHCDCGAPKGFSCKASCKARGKIARTGGEYEGKKVKSKKYGGPA